MYRDDLEAAQARADALAHEATEQKERADELEEEATALREKNARLEARAAEVAARAEVPRSPTSSRPVVAPSQTSAALAARMRRSVIGWSMMGVAVLLLLLGSKLGLGDSVLTIGIGVLIVGAWLA